jgi:ParB-like chromosome segregation protein Spo0J
MTAIQFDKYKVLPVEKLVKASWNYKTDNPDLLEKLKANIKRNGQVENILVRELPTGFWEICNGNHRAQALMDLGIKEVVVFDLGKISDAQARRIAVETNETKFETDNIRLAEIIKEISEEFADLDELSKTMPYTHEEIDNFNKLLTFDWEQYQSGSTEADDDAPSDGQEPPQE